MTRPPARLPSLRAALAAIALAGSFALAACQGQGEGERCDPLAGGNPPGTADCQDGLTCQQRNGTTSVCCPASGTSNSSACAVRTSINNNPAPTLDGEASEAGADATVGEAGDAAAE